MNALVHPFVAFALTAGFAPALPTASAKPPTDTAFMFQGNLSEEGKPANGPYDLSFRLLGEQYEVVVGGGPMWSSTDFMRPAAGWTVEDVLVTNGQFQVSIDFGPDVVYDGSVRFLEVAVRPGTSTGDFRILVPPHPLFPVPKALHARTAGQVIGLISLSNLPPSLARLDLPQVFTARPIFTPPSGAPFVVGLTDTVQHLSADLLDGLDSEAFVRARRVGDAVAMDVNPADRPIELHLQGERAFRLQPGNSALGSTVIGGSPGNAVAPGTPGVVVGGGRGNQVAPGAHFSGILSGDGNRIGTNAACSVIAGGTGQAVGTDAPYAGVFAGFRNVVSSNARFAGVLLGNYGTVSAHSDFATVVSGDANTVGPAAPHAAILSGQGQRIVNGASHSLIGSGQANLINTQASFSVVAGGQLNRIQPGAHGSFLGSGGDNEIGPSAYNSFLGGGRRNHIQFNAPFSAILGGDENLVRSNASWAAVLGGVGNVAGAPFTLAAGHGAHAEHLGSIILADGQYGAFPSKAAHEFAVRASGGVRLETSGKGLFVDGTNVLDAIAQGSLFVLRGVSVNAAVTELFRDGAARRMVIPRNAAWTFEMTVVARSATGTVAGYRQAGVVWDREGQLSMSPAPTQTLFEPSAAAPWDVQATISPTDDLFQVKVTGSSGQTIRWVATVRTAEVTF